VALLKQQMQEMLVIMRQQADDLAYYQAKIEREYNKPVRVGG